NGLEHHESTDIRDNEALFTDPARLLEHRTAPHEYVHSWNGKYRRPVGLATRNYQQPMVDDLLWVYEGMTRYLGDLVLRTRSLLATPEQARAYIAFVASGLAVDRPGRAWRSPGGAPGRGASRLGGVPHGPGGPHHAPGAARRDRERRLEARL